MRRSRLEEILAEEPTEAVVWHGTGKTDPATIIEDQQDGFMVQYCTTKGEMWGRGICFAVNASYSDSYAFRRPGTTHRVFLLTRLLAPTSTSSGHCARRWTKKTMYEYQDLDASI